MRGVALQRPRAGRPRGVLPHEPGLDRAKAERFVVALREGGRGRKAEQVEVASVIAKDACILFARLAVSKVLGKPPNGGV